MVWKDWFEKTKNSTPPNPLLIRALISVMNNNKALDLGSGVLNDSLYLLRQNFKHVTAVDKEPLAAEIADFLPKDRFLYNISRFENLNLPLSTFDLINAQYSLPFISSDNFDKVFDNIIGSLKSGGIFTGNLFGDRDSWNDDASMSFHSFQDVKRLLSNLQIILLDEEEKEDSTALEGIKHWHLFQFIAKK